ncbi:hypothetical protein, partial [Candidatus Ichthyocystis hellenicum]|uniref:hypothetical protein n=1 Tax=Candidatus Ichthyocystis hellenicum TaxID=1561003 RepID=UPI0011119415
MNNVCASSLQHYLDQDCKVTCSELGDKSKDNCDHVEVSDQSLSTQVMNASHVSVTSFTNKTDSDSLYNQLIQDLCPEYEYIINVKTISDVCGDSFFQEHAVRYGYKFTEYFLLVMENHKSSFLEKVDYILTGLCGSFSFLKELDSQSINIIYLMNKICFSFSECVYRLRSKCISVLQSDFIPIIVKVIFGSSVIDGDCERKMTYSEMDKLFLRFVITLEKLVMAKIMKYWRDFCDKNKSLLSLIPDVDYSNPFYYACHFDVISVPDATHPAAFTYKFGEYISFLAIAKIDIMSGNFVGKCADVLKVIIRYKCTHICDCSSDAYNDIKKLVKELHVLIKKEFDRKVVEDTVRDNFTKFFSDLMIWRQQVVEAKLVEGVVPSIVELITSDMYKSLMCILHGYLYDMVRNFHPYMMVSGKIVSSGGCDYLRTIENSLGVRIHPEDSYNIVALRSKFYSKFEKVVWNKFSVMLKEKHEFSDGTVISRVGWNRISKKLFPIAHGEIRLLIDMERLELSKLLSKVRIIDDVCVFDFSSVGSREATSEEKSIIFKLAIIKSDRKSKDLFRKVWVNLIKTTEDTKVDAVSVVEDVYPSVPTALPMRLNYYSSGSRADNIVNRWELNLHPDDDKLILFIRRNFSMDIRIYLHGLFSSMMAAKTVLSSGKVLHKCSWSLVSSDLYPIAIESVKPIIKREHEELYKVLSEARVIDVGGNDKFSCVIRKVTKEEKDDLLKRAKIFICSGLRHSFRLAWLDVIKAPEVSEKCEGSLPLQSESTTDRFIATDAIYSVAHIPLLYHQLLQDLCKGYGYNYIVDIKEESEIGDDNFLISHAIKYGYCFTEDFLLALMKNKSCFLEKVESILTGLCGSFSFLGELGNKSISIVSLMDKICYSFSNSVYDLRDKCIGVLQSEFVPTIIGIIFDSSIINDDCERKMTYPEKEQLFLFFITALERLIMVRIMKYWRDFCSENESL